MRKLAISCTAFSAGIFAAHYFLPLRVLLPLGAAVFVLSLAAMLLKKKALCAVLIFSAAGLLFYPAHYGNTVAKAEKFSTDSIQLEMLFISEVSDYSNYSSARVKILSKPYSGMTANLYDYSGVMNFSIGDIISADCKTKSSATKFGEQVDYNIARGIYVKAYLNNGDAALTGKRYTPQVIGSLINSYFRHTAEKLFSNPERSFIKALMLGDKTELYSDTDTYVSLSRSGFMHTVAVSGMHVAFVVSVILFLFGTGIPGSIICLAAVWLFVLVTGASPSAVRAAFMQTVLISAKLFNRENDSFTSLSFALACILINNPFAVSSISLQMSFAAVLGICVFSDKIRQYLFYSPRKTKGLKKILLKIWHYTAGILTASFSVMIFTVPLSVYYFGYISLLSFPMNILCLWAVPVCFGGGYLSCFAAPILPKLASLLASAVSILIRYILFVAKVVSKFKTAILYFELPVMKCWPVFVLAIFIICAFSKLSKKAKVLLPVILALISLLVIKGSINNTFSNKFDSYSVIDVGQGQCIAALSGDKTVLIDCGNQDEFFSNAGDGAASFLYSRERKHIDALFFTHIHSDHANGLEHLASLIDISAVFLPKCTVDDELYGKLKEICELKNIRIEFVDELSEYTYNNLVVTVFPPADYDAVNERCMKILLSDKEFDMLITGDISSTVEKEFINQYVSVLPQTEVLIAAHHGSRYSSCGEFLSKIGGKYAVISVGTNTYGHPTYETLERLDTYGYNIFRTDLQGTVSFYIRG